MNDILICLRSCALNFQSCCHEYVYSCISLNLLVSCKVLSYFGGRHVAYLCISFRLKILF